MPFGDRRFDFGVNIGWLFDKSGHDIGVNPYHPPGQPGAWPVLYDVDNGPDIIDSFFADIAARGFKVVRFWLFENFEGLSFSQDSFDPARIPNLPSFGLGGGAGASTLLLFDRHNKPDAIGIDPQLERNVVGIMRRAETHHLEIYWCILSAGNVFKDPARPDYWALTRLIRDPVLRRHFYDHALVPFLNVIAPHRSSVYAIDLVNEPEGLASGWSVSLSPEIRDYIHDAAAIVRERQFKCSVGFREEDAVKDYADFLKNDCRLDFFDFHVYNSDGDLAAYSADAYAGMQNCIIGEFGYRWVLDTTPDDPEQSTQARNLMANALNRGYQGCLIWRYSPVGDGKRLLRPGGRDLGSHEGRSDFVTDLPQDANRYWRPVKTPIETFGQDVQTHNQGGQ